MEYEESDEDGNGRDALDELVSGIAEKKMRPKAIP
jgi:hypothetical protein